MEHIKSTNGIVIHLDKYSKLGLENPYMDENSLQILARFSSSSFPITTDKYLS